MVHPFEIAAREVSQLDGSLWQHFVRELLRIEAAEVHLPVRSVESSELVMVGDGGVDAATRVDGESQSEWIHSNVSVWQCKAGEAAPSELKKDGIGPDAQQFLRQGGEYVLVVGTCLTSSMKRRRREALEGLLNQVGIDCSVEVLGAEDIALWASSRPAALALLQRSRGGFHFVSSWLNRQPPHQVPYEWSEKTTGVRNDLRRHIETVANSVHLHLLGAPGVGKTRLALETFSDEQLGAIYRPNADNIDQRLLDELIDRRDMSCLLIVDECSARQARRLRQDLAMAEGSIQLITIGTESLSDPQNQFEVDRMPDDVIEKVVQGVSPAIPPRTAQWIVGKVGGFVKLAHALAQLAAKSNVNLSILDLADLLKEMFPDERQLRALTVVALLSDVGWEGNLEVEGQALSKHMGLEWKECRRLISEAEGEGYIGRRGRQRYVTPDLLAIWLAGREWQRNRDDLLRVWTELAPGADDRFKRRLGQMGGVPEVAEFAKEVLGPDGPFRALAILNRERAARLFAELSRIEPEAAVRNLERTFRSVPDDELRTLGAGRREVVWALERLVAHRNLFPSAARLLLRLAVAENESYANNATGTFQSLFQPRGGATAATGEDRAELLEEIIERAAVPELLITVGALEQVFDVHGGHMVSADPSGVAPPTYWAAQTLEEHVEYCGRALELLERLLDHDAEQVRSAAERVLLERFRNFFWLGLSEQALNLAERPDLSESARRRLPLQADDIIQFDDDKWFMTAELRDRLQNLQQSIYADPLRERLHLRLGSWNHDLHRAARDSSEDFFEAESREFKELVKDLLLQPVVLQDEFEWIVSEEAVNGQRFLSYLGEHDLQREWLSPILEASVESNRPDLISSYVFGLSRSANGTDVEALLDEWAADNRFRHLVLHATASLGLSERRAKRVLDLLDEGLDPQISVCLSWAHPNHEDDPLRFETFAALLRRMVLGGDLSRDAAWNLAGNVFTRHQREGWTDTTAAFELLWYLTANLELNDDFDVGAAPYHWAECAKLLAKRDPERLVAAIVQAVLDSPRLPHIGTYVREVLEACFEADPSRAWRAYANGLADPRTGAWVLETWGAEADIAGRVGLDVIRAWVNGAAGEEREHRAETVARLTRVDTELTALIRWIVTEFEYSEKVGDELMFERGVRFVWGSMADALEPRLESAREWSRDNNLAVRQWAQRLVDGLEQEVASHRVMDEESELRR